MARNLNRARALIGFGAVAAGLSMVSIGSAQTTQAVPAQSPAASTAASLPSSLDALAWLRGCWTGSVNRREFIEQWSPPRGGMMVGFSHTVIGPKFQGSLREKMEAVGKTTEPGKDKTQDFEYLRLEARDDGIYYIAVPSGKKEIAFRLGSVGEEESGATVFTFNNTVDEFPQRLIYRRGSEGWLYAQVAGKPGTAGGDVVYPMRHVDCATDAVLKE